MTQCCTDAWQQYTQSYRMVVSHTHTHISRIYCQTVIQLKKFDAASMWITCTCKYCSQFSKQRFQRNPSQTVIWSLWFRRQGVTFTHRIPSIITYCTASSRDYRESCISVMNVRVYPFIYITVAHKNAICVHISPKTMMLRKCWFWTQLLIIYKNQTISINKWT